MPYREMHSIQVHDTPMGLKSTLTPAFKLVRERLVAVALKRLRVKVTFPVSWYFDLLEPANGGHQIAPVMAVAVPFALRATFSPGHSNERLEFLTHHDYYLL